jgi:hypothetical protein
MVLFVNKIAINAGTSHIFNLSGCLQIVIPERKLFSLTPEICTHINNLSIQASRISVSSNSYILTQPLIRPKKNMWVSGFFL